MVAMAALPLSDRVGNALVDSVSPTSPSWRSWTTGSQATLARSLDQVSCSVDGGCTAALRRDHELGVGRLPLTTMAATSDGASGLSSP